uniref:Uncharacterized protein n=1 Tax=viral metagenome TaxID=1070528 RepID=A0A6C0KE17_9ZZZZ
MTWCDYIVSTFFDVTVANTTISTIVDGTIDEKPDTWYGGEDIFGRKNRDNILSVIGNVERRGGRRVTEVVLQSMESRNVLAQKSVLLVCSFVRAAAVDDATGVAKENMGVDEEDLRVIEQQRQLLIAGFRKKMEDGTFKESDEIITGYYTQLSQTGIGLGFDSGSARENSFSCRNMTHEQLNRIMLLNFGSSSLTLLYKPESNSFKTKDEICSSMDEKLKGVVERVASSKIIYRKTIFMLEYGMTALRGFYYMLHELFVATSGAQDTGPFLLGLAAAYKFINPFALMFRVAGVLDMPWLSLGMPLLLFVMWFTFGRNSSYSFNAGVAGGATRHYRQDGGRGEGTIMSDRSFGEDTATELKRQQDLLFAAQRAVDENVHTKIQEMADAGDWQTMKNRLPADFGTVCASAQSTLNTEDFMQMFYRNQSTMSKISDRVDQWFFSVPQRFFASLKPSLTLDDVFNSQGQKRNSTEICVAVYLRMESEHRPVFTSFMETFVPRVRS